MRISCSATVLGLMLMLAVEDFSVATLIRTPGSSGGETNVTEITTGELLVVYPEETHELLVVHPEETHEPLIVDLKTIHFFLWTKKNQGDDDKYELIIYDIQNLQASPFNANFPTYVLVHGFQSSYTAWPMQAKTELLKRYPFNVIALDWRIIAGHLYYPSVVKVLPEVAQYAAEFLEYLNRITQFRFTSLYMIGHSLGAHLSGFVGAQVKYGPIKRITGLDPAGPYFNDVPANRRLDKTDAVFVDIIHTNGCRWYRVCFGIVDQIGDVDFYPNGGKLQPGCIFEDNVGEMLHDFDDKVAEMQLGSVLSCSHSRAYEFWIESITGITPFTSVLCQSWELYKEGNCSGPEVPRLDMGFHAANIYNGKFYLATNSEPPYAQGPIG